MRSGLLFLTLAIAFSACSLRKQSDLSEIQEVMDGQARAWNQGNIDAYMSGYWMSDSLIFTGGKSVSLGWQAALDRYKKSYPNKESMGHLKFSDVNTRFTSKESAYSTGQWTLERSQDTLSGRFTLVWKTINGSWFIIADHSS